MNLDGLATKLEALDDDAQVLWANAIARRADASQLKRIASLVRSPSARVRMGVMRALDAAGFRPAAKLVASLARAAHDPQERALALRVAAALAEPSVVGIAPQDPLQALLSHDPVIRRRAIAATRRSASPHDAAELFAKAVRRARGDGARLDLLGAWERLPLHALTPSAVRLLQHPDSGLIALAARALARVAGNPTDADRQRLEEALSSARVRHPEPIARAAIDDCAAAISGALALRFASGVPDAGQLHTIAKRLTRMSDAVLARQATPLVEVVEAKPELLAPLASPLTRIWQMSETEQLRPTLVRAARAWLYGSERRINGDAVAAARLLGFCLPRGCALPVEFCRQLASEPVALIALREAIAGEDDAACLIRLRESGDPETRDLANQALMSFRTPPVMVDTHQSPPVIRLGYLTPDGRPLRASRRFLRSPDGAQWVLDAGGNVIPEGDAFLGTCTCCPRARARVRGASDDSAPICPTTGEQAADWQPAAQVAPTAAATEAKASVARPVAPTAAVPAVRMGDGEPTTFNEQVGRAQIDISHAPPQVQRAYRANVVMHTEGSGASGTIIDRRGDDVLILTNRHVVLKDGTDDEYVHPKGRTIGGEVFKAETLWVCPDERVDVAICFGSIKDSNDIQPCWIERDVPTRIGEPVFNVGNPLGLEWTYADGKIAAVRQVSGDDGDPIRYLQLDARLGRGTSGSGIYSSQGDLIGIVAWGRSGMFDESYTFAVSIDTIIAAIDAANVSFRGTPILR